MAALYRSCFASILDSVAQCLSASSVAEWRAGLSLVLSRAVQGVVAVAFLLQWLTQPAARASPLHPTSILLDRPEGLRPSGLPSWAHCVRPRRAHPRTHRRSPSARPAGATPPHPRPPSAGCGPSAHRGGLRPPHPPLAAPSCEAKTTHPSCEAKTHTHPRNQS